MAKIEKYHKLISLNTEAGKHFGIQKSFLKAEKADVICLQEIFKSDFLLLKKHLSMYGLFTPTWIRTVKNKKTTKPMGIALLSKFPIKRSSVLKYGEDEILDKIPGERLLEQRYRHLLITRIMIDGLEYIIGTLHFTWSPNGKPTPIQKEHASHLFYVLDKLPEFILCGDFNSPRGSEIFDKLSQKYTDNIPIKYKTSIDKKLHRAGDLKLMVDGLFSKNSYKIKNVRLVTGVSDHYAIKALVKRES